MPTYYTADVCDVKKPLPSVKDFALKCAEAFLIEYRDGNYDSIRDNVEPDPYYKERLAEEEKEIEDWQNKSVEEKRNQIIEEISNGNLFNQKAIDEFKKTNERISTMLRQIDAAVWPEELGGLVQFMHDQLVMSILQCSYLKETAITEELINKRLALKEESFARTLKYYQEEWDKEQKRTAQRNQWVKTLKETLNV